MPDERAQGGPSITQITELLRQADRLGLTWGRRPGTVQSTTGLFTTTQASVIMDGDDVGITVVSLIGALVVGDRVMVDRVPPAGLYVMAKLNPPASPFTEASTSTSGTITAETVMFTLSAVELREGYAYRVEGGNRVNAGAAVSVRFQLRKTDISGTVVAQSPNFAGAGLGLSTNAHWTSFIAPAADMTSDFVYTLAATGVGATSIGTATAPRFISITLAGVAESFPQAVLVS